MAAFFTIVFLPLSSPPRIGSGVAAQMCSLEDKTFGLLKRGIFYVMSLELCKPYSALGNIFEKTLYITHSMYSDVIFVQLI